MTGTTATVCLIRDSSEMVVGHVGDSRAVLCRKGSSVRLSVDHDPDDPDENQRVTKKGGRIIQNSQGISQVRYQVTKCFLKAFAATFSCMLYERFSLNGENVYILDT